MNIEMALDRMVDAEIDDAIEAAHVYHKFGGLNGLRCGYQPKPFETTKISLTWDSVTCPDCLAKKRETEPWTTDIDTRGD